MKYQELQVRRAKINHITAILDVLRQSNNEKVFTDLIIDALDARIDEMQDRCQNNIHRDIILQRLEHLNLIKSQLEKLNTLLIFK